MNDLSHNKFGYNQFTGGIDYSYSRKKWKLNTNVSIVQKNYTKLEIKNDNEYPQKLTYHYGKFGVNIGFKLKKNLMLYVDAFSKIRISNVDSDFRKTTRNYMTNQIMFGVKWDIKGKYK
jgi:hypothetical protein